MVCSTVYPALYEKPRGKCASASPDRCGPQPAKYNFPSDRSTALKSLVRIDMSTLSVQPENSNPRNSTASSGSGT